MKANDDIFLGVGHISHDKNLGGYYQDFLPAEYHFDNNSLGKFDENGIPYLIEGDWEYYSIVYIVQYAILQHDKLILAKGDQKTCESNLKNCLDWLDNKAEKFKDSLVWRSEKSPQYGLEKGWISAMYQGQIISLYLRAYQYFSEEKYLNTAHLTFKSLRYDYAEGGVKRIDDNGYIWFEEYPTDPPSFVLNGYIYTIFGIYDYYRVTSNQEALTLWNECLRTLKDNLPKYHKWYWSVYDQLKKQLVSFYYQKNVHVPLMDIMYKLTNETHFKFYRDKWNKQLNSALCNMIVKVMYRIQPRIRKLAR